MSEIIRNITTKKIIQREFNYETSSIETRNYRDRVYSNGGIINNPLLVEYAFQTIALLTSILGRTPLWVSWIDASFGIKIDSSNRVLKVYDLLGLNDFGPIGDITTNPVLIKDSQGYYCLQFDGNNDGLSSENLITWNTNKVSFIFVNQFYSSTNRILSSYNGIAGTATQWHLGGTGAGNNKRFATQSYSSGSFTGYYYSNDDQKHLDVGIFDEALPQVLNGRVKAYHDNVNVTLLESNSLNNNALNYNSAKIDLFHMSNVSRYASGRFYGSSIFKEALSPVNTKLLADFYNKIHNTY